MSYLGDPDVANGCESSLWDCDKEFAFPELFGFEDFVDGGVNRGCWCHVLNDLDRATYINGS